MKTKKIRITHEFLEDICYWGYDHGKPVNNIVVYTTLGMHYYEPLVKIIQPRRGGKGYMASHFTVRCPKNIMFKGFTMEEFCRRFYAVKNRDKITFKFYK